MHLLRRPAVLLLACLVAVGGCSPTAGSQGSPDGSARSTTTSAPAYRAPEAAPAEVSAAAADLDHAVDFVLAWFDTLNYSLSTGDPDPLRATTGLGCFTCANWIIETQTQMDQGQTRTGGEIAVGTVVFVGQTAPGDFIFRTSLTQHAGSVRSPEGRSTPIPGNSTELVDVTVGVSTSALQGTSAWTMKSITVPG